MAGSEDLIKSLQVVVESFLKHQKIEIDDSELSKPLETVCHRKLLESINYINELVANLPPEIDDDIKQAIHHSELITSIKAVSTPVTQKKNLFKLEDASSIPLLALLGRECDENFHSDYLANILTSQRMGQYSKALLERILSLCSSKPIVLNGDHVKVEREKLLGDFDVSKDLEKRRIDLFIQTSDHIIVIENKINSFELEDQTKDYYEGVFNYYREELLSGRKKFIAILLSPSKLVAGHPAFKSMSYVELTKTMLETNQSPLSEINKTFVNLYIRSIAYTFVEKEINYETELAKFWRKSA